METTGRAAPGGAGMRAADARAYQVVPLFLLVNTVREGTLLVVLTALACRTIAVAAAGTDYTRGWPSAANGWCGWCISPAP